MGNHLGRNFGSHRFWILDRCSGRSAFARVIRSMRSDVHIFVSEGLERILRKLHEI